MSMKDNKTPARLYLSCGLRAQTHSLGQTKETTCFTGTAMSTGLRIVSGCFRDTVGELNRCDRDGMSCKAHIDYPALSRKSLPSPNWGRLPREALAQPAGCWDITLVITVTPPSWGLLGSFGDGVLLLLGSLARPHCCF